MRASNIDCLNTLVERLLQLGDPVKYAVYTEEVSTWSYKVVVSLVIDGNYHYIQKEISKAVFIDLKYPMDLMNVLYDELVNIIHNYLTKEVYND